MHSVNRSVGKTQIIMTAHNTVVSTGISYGIINTLETPNY